MHMSKKHIICFFAVIIFISTQSCSPRYQNKENAVSTHMKLSPHLSILFTNTKLLCFGRYAIDVPQEAEIIWGSTSFPAKIEVHKGNLASAEQQVIKDIAKIKKDNRTAEIIFNGKGPIDESFQIQYYEDKYAKEDNDIFLTTYLIKENFIFIFGDATEKGESKSDPIIRQAKLAANLRLRENGESPLDPGYCIDHGFIADKQYEGQEIVNVGIFLPSLPDVIFSISSNKNAYAEYASTEFERTMRAKLSLLARIQQAQEIQGARYPKRMVLREGKSDINHWRGEESLIKRSDGVHDFEWALVGTPKDIANPSEFNIQMYTKVAQNTVGAAKASSLNDDEAVAFWDKILSGLKFRVKVPGAPDGSYHISGKN